MKHPFRGFLYFSRGERRGILVLIAGIIVVFLCGELYSYRQSRLGDSDKETREQLAAIGAYHDFAASVEEVRKKARPYPKYPVRAPEAVISPIRFNPNTADSATFRRLGLPDWVARNILRYRERGGKFRKAEDFGKMYGLTEKQRQLLLPYIFIAPEDTARRVTPELLNRVPRDTVYKYPAGTVISLNNADTLELKKIPGIGSGIARLIVGYRERLGGFYRIEQLQDIGLDYRPLKVWFNINPGEIRRTNLNRASVDRLRNHPYINFYQAKALVEYRKKNGVIQSLKPFALYEEFKEGDLDKITPYVCFE